MGDPAGVGPELCLKLLNEPAITQICTPLIFGDAAVLAACAQKLGLQFAASVLSADKPGNSLAQLDQPSVIDFGAITLNQFTPVAINAATGAASHL